MQLILIINNRHKRQPTFYQLFISSAFTTLTVKFFTRKRNKFNKTSYQESGTVNKSVTPFIQVPEKKNFYK